MYELVEYFTKALYIIYKQNKKEGLNMNISTFLALPAFKDFRILAGESGLNNEITGVNILDNPQAADWLSPGELIVTSGYFFKESPETMEHFITSFHRLNIPAICIKPQIYLNPLPEKLIQLCDDMAIPLIEIPYGLAFSKILNTVMNLLSDSHHEAAQVALEMNSQFLEYELKGEGLDYLENKLENLLSNPLIITDPDWILLTENLDDSFTPYTKEKGQNTTFDIKSLVTLPVKVSQLKHPVTISFKDGTSGLILPIFFTEVTYGYMIVLQKNKPLTQKDYIIMEQAKITFALEIVHQTEKLRSQNRILRDFYRKLLFSSQPIEELHSYDINFNYDIPYSVFVISADLIKKKKIPKLQQEHNDEVIYQHLLKTALNFRHPLFKDIHLFKQGNSFIGLLGHSSSEISEQKKQLKNFFKTFSQYLQNFFAKSINLTFFVGTIQPLGKLNYSYEEAIQMMGYYQQHEESVYYADQFYFENFIYRLVNQEEATDFIFHYLKPLIDYDQETDSHLLETLIVYLENHQNLAAASRQLFVHRNTLLYRIEKIESLLENSLTNYDYSLKLSVALKLLKNYPSILNAYDNKNH